MKAPVIGGLLAVALLVVACNTQQVAWAAGQELRLSNMGHSDGPFLKINDVYVLYLRPAAPYLEGGQVMVPMQSFADLTGMTATFDVATGEAVVSFDQHHLRLSAGSPGATLDGGALRLPVTPSVLHPYGALAIPVQATLDAVGITWRWDGANTLHVLDDRMLSRDGPRLYPNGQPNLREGLGQRFLAAEGHPGSAALTPTYFEWEWLREPIDDGAANRIHLAPHGGRFTLVLARQAGDGPPLEDLAVSVYITSYLWVQGYGDGSSPFPGGPPPSGCRRMPQRGVLTCSSEVAATGEPIRFVLARPWAFR